MNSIKPGYSLPEVILWLTIRTAIIMTVLTNIVPELLKTRMLIQRCCFYMQSNGVFYMFDRDMIQAPLKRSQWHTISSQELIWPISLNESCGYRIKDNTLIRYKGVFNPQTKQWSLGSKSMVLQGFEKAHFVSSIDQAGQIVKAIGLSISKTPETTLSWWAMPG